jgi:hypothetical protein
MGVVTGGARDRCTYQPRRRAEGAGVVINYHRSDKAAQRWPKNWVRAQWRCRPM